MSTEITNPFGSSAILGNREEMAKRAAASAATVPSAGGAPDGSDFLSFSGKRGLYTVGKDKRQIQPDELWLLNVASFEDGWVCWKGGKPIAKRTYNIYTGTPVERPASDELGPFDDKSGWSACKCWVSKSIDNDQQGFFEVTSISGVSEMASMIEEVSRRMAVGLPCWPLFHYDMKEFSAQGHKNFKPDFKVYGWLDDDAVGKVADPSADVDELIKASAGIKSVASDENSDDAAASEDTPSPRRRRSAS
tara:strand:+ start:1931 stop:2677 length:747 start_codon:yes stop_codon:yes gene_type:complete